MPDTEGTVLDSEVRLPSSKETLKLRR
jgi:hypothetical protein